MIKSETPVGDYWDTWYRFKCPHCNKLNWICDGDTTDCSLPDKEVCICHNCKKKFWMGDNVKEEQELNAEDCTPDELGLEPDDDLIEYAFDVQGKEKP